jgi:hypothetical protein
MDEARKDPQQARAETASYHVHFTSPPEPPPDYARCQARQRAGTEAGEGLTVSFRCMEVDCMILGTFIVMGQPAKTPLFIKRTLNSQTQPS